LSIAVTGPDDAWTLQVDDANTEHEVPILGLTPNGTFQVVVTASTEDGSGELPLLSFSTEPLPQPFPEIVVEASIPGSMEPGLTMFDVGETAAYLVVIDHQGRVVWLYVPPGPGVGDVRLLPNGNLLYLAGSDIYEMTMLGDIVHHVEPSERDRRFHHEVFPSAEGTYLTLGFEVTEVDDFHTSEIYPEPLATVDVTDDTILEVETDGTVVRRHSLLDILDPSRIGYDSLSDHFRLETPNDWAHANAIISSDGTLLLFDNGNHRASPYDGLVPLTPEESYSRAVEYRIDEDKMTVEQVWEYGAELDPRLYASFISDADHMPGTGNVLITFGGLRGLGSETSEEMGRGRFQSRLREVQRGGPDRIVFDVSIYSNIDDSADGFRSYRSERIPSFH